MAGRSRTKAEESSEERLHVRIARSGLCSRRAAERLILEGRVELNGVTVSELGVKVSAHDEVKVDGKAIQIAKHYTVLLNKPVGVVTTLSDPQRRQTIERFLPDYGVQLKPVGRLDMNTEGLLICTNDGELALRLSHPRYGVEKEYVATVRGVPSEKALNDLRKGIYIEGGRTQPAVVELLHSGKGGTESTVKVIIHEGRKRQIRLMFDAIDYPVSKLRRVRIAMLKIRGMRTGECVLLGKSEVDALRRLVGLEPL